MAIPYESGESTFFSTVKMNTFVQMSSLGVQKMTKSIQFYRRKKGTIKNSYEMINFRRECVQIHLFYHAKRPSPSPLSHGIAFYDAAGSKMHVPYESSGGFFASLHFARDCRPFLEGCAPAVPKIGILDESGEGFSEKSQKPLRNTREMEQTGVI